MGNPTTRLYVVTSLQWRHFGEFSGISFSHGQKTITKSFVMTSKFCADEIVPTLNDCNVDRAEAAHKKLISLNREVIVLLKEFEEDHADRPTFRYWMN